LFILHSYGTECLWDVECGGAECLWDVECGGESNEKMFQ
jgi:hypothetical protein